MSQLKLSGWSTAAFLCCDMLLFSICDSPLLVPRIGRWKRDCIFFTPIVMTYRNSIKTRRAPFYCPKTSESLCSLWGVMIVGWPGLYDSMIWISLGAVFEGSIQLKCTTTMFIQITNLNWFVTSAFDAFQPVGVCSPCRRRHPSHGLLCGFAADPTWRNNEHRYPNIHVSCRWVRSTRIF